MTSYTVQPKLNEVNPNSADAKQVTTDIERKTVLGGLRWILTILSMFSFGIMFFSRNAFSVAFVVMINSTDVEKENFTDVCPLALQNRTDEEEAKEMQGEFNWSPEDEGIILATFFWGIMISKVFGSRIVEVIGQRRYVAIGTSVGGILLLLSPLAAEIHPMALASTSFLIGLAFGPTTAAVFSLLAVWAPQHELGTMTSIAQAGGPIGIFFGLAISGLLAENVGWRSPFLVSGGLCFVFLPFWIIFVRNTPKEHPWLTPNEEKILECNKDVKTQKTVPWLSILKSPYVHICTLSLFARSWSEVIFSSGGPTFFNKKIGLGLSESSFVCSGRFLVSLITLPIYGRISDKLVKDNYLKKKNARKLFHFIGVGGLGLIFIAISLAGCSTKTVITLWVLSGGLASATSLSFPVSVIDFAPNYAGTVTGILGIGNLGSALVPIVVSALVQKENGWNKSYYLSAALCLLSCVLYILFMTDEPQSWNFKKDKDLSLNDKTLSKIN